MASGDSASGTGVPTGVPANYPLTEAAGALTGRELGGFVVREQVGAGGYGDVYLAEQIGLRREAIVKVLRPGEEMTDGRIQRFLREAQLASKLDHPYAAHIYAFGTEPDGVFWIAMERVRGASLRAVLDAQGPMSLERFVPLLERICEVVHTAHDQGIVHRDLKPDNVMVISRAGRLLPKLLDFGIARGIGNDQPTIAMPRLDAEELDRPVDVTTQRGAVLGSPPYMAPEVWVDPHGAGPGADQYALGALAYEALTGRVAFAGKKVIDYARAHARGGVAPLGDGFPVELDAVIKRALARKADDRYGNVLELAQAFRSAAGIGGTTVEIPQLDEELRVKFLTCAPQPLAEAVAAYDAAKNAHQAREALRGVVRISAWLVGVLALACRTRVGGGATGDSEHAQSLLRDLRRDGLTPARWIALARQLTLPFARLPDTYPLPELVLLLQRAAGDVDPFIAVLEGSLSESLPDTSDEAASQSIARELPSVTALLRALTFLLDYQLVVPRDGHAESWMGVRGGARRIVPLRRALADARPVLVDATGGPVVAVWPLVQAHAAVPGHAEELFLLAGPGRQGARLVSSPHGFEHADDALWDWFRDQLFRGDDPAGTAQATEAPYRGLTSYTRGEAAWFFGRERESEALVNRLKLEPFVAIVGPSGVGKSSFVQAGLVPSLPGWRVVTTRPGRAPIDQLGAALELPDLRPAATADLELVAAKLRASAGDGLLIVIDQFEETLTLGASDDERALFVRILLAAARAPELPVRVVITLRDDFLIRAQQLPGLDRALARGLQLLGPLAPPALERIVVEPARRAGYEFEDAALPARMVAEVAGTPAAVALISFTAARLWELRDRHFHQLPRKAYDAIGGVGGALAQHADETVDAMPGAERALVRKAFRHLVTFDGTRAVLGRDELAQLIGGGADAEHAIERLVEARLVVSSEGEGGAAVVEIIHEALLAAWPRLVEWRREDVDGSRFHEQLRAAAKQWHDRKRPRGLLWRGDALAEYQLWRKRHPDDLTPVEAAFGAASVTDANRGRRIRRALVSIALVVTAVFVVILWRANNEQRRASEAEHKSREAADQSRVAAENLLRDSSFDQGRLMVLQGDKLAALDHLAKAFHMGETGSSIRFLIEEAIKTARPRLLTLAGHTDKLWQVAYSPDGKRIATGSADGNLRLWDAATGAALDVIPHGAPVLAVAFSRDGRLLASGGRDNAVVVWDVAARKVIAKLDVDRRVDHIAINSDGTRVAATSYGGFARVWSLPAGAIVRTLPGHRGDVGFAFCASDDCAATWDDGGHAAIWDGHSFAQRTEYNADQSFLTGAVDRTGSTLALGGSDGALYLSTRGAKLVIKPGADYKSIEDIAISPDGKWIATASRDNNARIWDAHTGETQAFLVGHRAGVMTVRFSPSGDQIATAGNDGTARLWDTATGAPLGELDGHTNAIFSIAFSPDGARLATASWDRRAMVWDLARGRDLRPIEPASYDMFGQAPGPAFSPDGTRIAYSSQKGELVVVDATSLRVTCRAPLAKSLHLIAWSGDGRSVATAEIEGPVVMVWDVATCKSTRKLDHPDDVTAIAWGGSDRLLTGCNDHLVRLWPISSETPPRVFAAMPGIPSHVGFATDDQIYALVFDKDSAVVLEDVSAPSTRRVFTASHLPLSAIRIDRARHEIQASSYDQNVWIWDDRSGALITKLEGTGPLFSLTASRDGKIIVAIGGQAPTLFDADSHKKLATLTGHGDLVERGGFLDDRMLITSARDGTARVWDVTTARALQTISGAPSVTISPDRRLVLLVDVGGTRIWTPRNPQPDLGELERLIRAHEL